MGAITQELWPGVPVVPFMTPTITDMRWFRNAGIPMYGITGMFVDPVNNGMHGLNEHIGQYGRDFLYRLIKMLTS